MFSETVQDIVMDLATVPVLACATSASQVQSRLFAPESDASESADSRTALGGWQRLCHHQSDLCSVTKLEPDCRASYIFLLSTHVLCSCKCTPSFMTE